MEIELKLALHPCHIVRIQRYFLLREILPQQRSLLSTYFDTPKFDLMQRRIALRIRQIDGQCIQTLKAETKSVGALTSRPEWETHITSSSHPDFSVLPRIATNLLAGIKLKYIAPIFTTDFQRTTWQVDNQKEHAEVALDIGKIYAGETYRNICEVEIELKLGAPVLLFDIATQLLQQLPLHIEPRSKAERGYLLSSAMYAAPTKAIYSTIHKDQTAAESWNAIIQAALTQMVANVPGFLENAYNIEYLRQLCSALQRLHIGVSLTKSLNQALPDWGQPLSQLMKELDSALDWHVFLYETLPKILAISEKSSINTLIDDAALNLMHEVGANTCHRAQTLLLKPTFTQLALDIGRSLLFTLPNAKIQNTTAWAESILEKHWRNLRKHCQDFGSLSTTRRYLARIAAEKMRSVAETFVPLYGELAIPFITTLAALENELEYTSDMIIGVQLLKRLPTQSSTLNFELGRIIDMLEFGAVQHTNLASPIWQELAYSELFWRKKARDKENRID